MHYRYCFSLKNLISKLCYNTGSERNDDVTMRVPRDVGFLFHQELLERAAFPPQGRRTSEDEVPEEER